MINNEADYFGYWNEDQHGYISNKFKVSQTQMIKDYFYHQVFLKDFERHSQGCHYIFYGSIKDIGLYSSSYITFIACEVSISPWMEQYIPLPLHLCFLRLI